MSIYDNLGAKVFTNWNKYMEMESEETLQVLQHGVSIGELSAHINELKATNHAINDLEYEYDKLKLEYDTNITRTANSPELLEKYRSMEQRKDLSKAQHSETKQELIEINRQLRELKANKEGLEYEIRFYFKILFQQAPSCQCKHEEGKTDEQEN